MQFQTVYTDDEGAAGLRPASLRHCNPGDPVCAKNHISSGDQIIWHVMRD